MSPRIESRLPVPATVVVVMRPRMESPLPVPVAVVVWS